MRGFKPFQLFSHGIKREEIQGGTKGWGIDVNGEFPVEECLPIPVPVGKKIPHPHPRQVPRGRLSPHPHPCRGISPRGNPHGPQVFHRHLQSLHFKLYLSSTYMFYSVFS